MRLSSKLFSAKLSDMRTTLQILGLWLLATQGLSVPTSASQARSSTIAARQQGSVVSIRVTSPWSRAPGSGMRSAYIRAETSNGQRKAAPVGGCGVELCNLSNDGLETGNDLKPRAVLSGTLLVEPQYRRQGVAQLLLREAESRERTWGVSAGISTHPSSKCLLLLCSCMCRTL